MDRTTAPNYVTVSGKRQFVDQNLLGGITGTEIVAADPTAWQEELLGPIEGAGLTPSSANLKQLWQAIKRVAGANIGPTITTSTALTADDAGWVIVDATSGNIVLTLPLSNSAGGTPFTFRIARIDSTSAHSVAVAFSGSDGALFTEPTTVAPGQVLEVGASGGTTWINWLALGSASLVATAGWERRPTGMIEQWARSITVTGTADPITFPIPFPNACTGVNIDERHAASWVAGVASIYGIDNDPTTTGFSVWCKQIAAAGGLSAGSTSAFFYRALGW